MVSATTISTVLKFSRNLRIWVLNKLVIIVTHLMSLLNQMEDSKDLGPRLPPIKITNKSQSRIGRSKKREELQMKSWMKEMVQRSLNMGNDIAYIKGMLMKNRERDKIEQALTTIKRNIKVINKRNQHSRRPIPNSFYHNISSLS